MSKKAWIVVIAAAIFGAAVAMQPADGSPSEIRASCEFLSVAKDRGIGWGEANVRLMRVRPDAYLPLVSECRALGLAP